MSPRGLDLSWVAGDMTSAMFAPRNVSTSLPADSAVGAKLAADPLEIDLGDRTLRAIETPGHAYHHHAYLDESSGTVFTGDSLGVRLPDVGVVRPATPPPEFHLEKTVASIRRIAALAPERLCLTHFGPAEAPPEQVCEVDASHTAEYLKPKLERFESVL